MTTGAEYWEGKYNTLVEQCDALMDTIRAGEMTDGHHTHNELYAYRLLYNALLFNEWFFNRKYDVHKSKKHSDGEECFGGGWFIVVATLPTGQVSNHYKLEFWDWFHVPERELPVAYDGHTPEMALDRMQELLTWKPALMTCRAQKWNAEPCYEGVHGGHFFYYGSGIGGQKPYEGYCTGWPKPPGTPRW